MGAGTTPKSPTEFRRQCLCGLDWIKLKVDVKPSHIVYVSLSPDNLPQQPAGSALETPDAPSKPHRGLFWPVRGRAAPLTPGQERRQFAKSLGPLHTDGRPCRPIHGRAATFTSERQRRQRYLRRRQSKRRGIKRDQPACRAQGSAWQPHSQQRPRLD